jgi:drug/metabolite transporter (DMT)-like permease
VALFYLSFGITILSSVLYHLFQRAIAPAANPVVSVLVTYLVAIVLTLPLFALYPLKSNLAAAIRQLNGASAALAVAIVGLEIGFLLAYRAGWNISLAGVATNAAAALVLLPVGIVFFKERMTVINIAGVLVCIAGLLMVNSHR